MVAIYRSEVIQARQGLGAGARPWERTGSIDIEVLVNWAYGEQMVDRFERSGLHAIEAEAAGFEPRGYSGCGVGQLMQIEHLGCRIDGGGVKVSDAVHPAALAVAGAMGDVDPAWRSRVQHYARSGLRPAGWVRPERAARASVWVKEGIEAQVEYQGPGRKGAWCPVIILWDSNRQAWGQADYLCWWRGLDELVGLLSLRAMGFSITGPAAPMTPWDEPELFARGSAGAPPNGSSQRVGV